MYKYGVVSTASITKRFIDGLRLAGDEVVCIGSRDISKAKQFSLENSINRYYGSYDEVYQDEEVDIFYIPVLNSLHYDCAKRALLHKKHANTLHELHLMHTSFGLGTLFLSHL